MSNLIKLYIQHGGIFKKDNELKYVGGEVKIYEDIDPDELCYFWLQELACIQGKYSRNGDIYFLIPGLSLDTGLRRIFNDVEVLEMAKYVTVHGSIQMFVVHSVDTSVNESQHNISFQCARKKLTPLRSKEKQSNTSVDASNVRSFDGLYDDFKSRPHWPASEICDTVRKAYRVIIKRGYAYKVKYWAHKKLHGSMKEHYNKICSYIQALKETSPNCVFKIQTEPPREPNPPIFKRFFACFDALSEGWLEGCRKIICLDGCFLKTFLGGMLLAAVGRDANDQMYPIAWAVVEGENNDSWEWFLFELRSCLRERNQGDGWTFISDQQKGILNAVSNVFGKAEHRNCARHIYANWHKTYKGDELKGLFWRAVRAYNMADYNAAIEELDRLNQAAATALKAQNPKTFCRAFVKTNTKCDVIVNNMAETFNGYIINARTKHMIYMLEDIRTALMQRLVNKKVYMKKLDTLLCPRIQAKLDKEKDKVGDCYAMPSNEVLFQVNYKMMDNLTVDLQQKTCTCGKWQLTGIPCCHVIACIYLSGEEAEPYVDECYYTTTYLKSYSRAIHPCKGERYWAKLNMPIDPPQIKIGPGRPRRNRRKDPHENPKKPGRLTRHGTELTCSVCKSTKHTKRKCPDKDKVVESQPKRGRGRPRKYEVTQPSQRQFEAANLSTHHNVTAEPSRTTRGGRTITRGRTFQKGNGSRGDKGRNVPTGFGVYVAPSGATMINNPGQASPTILSTGTASANYVNTFSSKASENSSMINQFPRTTNHG